MYKIFRIEDIETSKNLNTEVSWIWIDTFTKLPLNSNNLETVNKFSSCLVSPLGGVVQMK